MFLQVGVSEVKEWHERKKKKTATENAFHETKLESTTTLC